MENIYCSELNSDKAYINIQMFRRTFSTFRFPFPLPFPCGQKKEEAQIQLLMQNAYCTLRRGVKIEERSKSKGKA